MKCVLSVFCLIVVLVLVNGIDTSTSPPVMTVSKSNTQNGTESTTANITLTTANNKPSTSNMAITVMATTPTDSSPLLTGPTGLLLGSMMLFCHIQLS